MLQTTLIGHLGADAEVKSANGKEFITMRVAHTDKYTDQDGVEHTNTTWVDCIINGKSNVLPYLKKGTQIFVSGSTTLRCYSSPKEKRMVAGLTINVRTLELIGGKPETVPGILYRQDNGEQVKIDKFYFALALQRDQNADEYIPLVSQSAQQFVADRNGCVQPYQSSEK